MPKAYHPFRKERISLQSALPKQCRLLVGEGGFAFLRKSHGGGKAPPGPCQEPPFESTFRIPKRRKASHPLRCLAFLVGEGGFEDDYFSANTIYSVLTLRYFQQRHNI